MTDATASRIAAMKQDHIQDLRAFVDRTLERVDRTIASWENEPGPAWVEEELAACEAYIREMSSISGMLDYEGGQELARAKTARRRLRLLREEAVRPYRERARSYRAFRARFSQARQSLRQRDPTPEAVRALVELVEGLGKPPSAEDRRTLRLAKAYLLKLESARGEAGAIETASPVGGQRLRGKVGHEPSRSDEPGDTAAVPRPAGLDPSPEVLARYLPPPSPLELDPPDAELLLRFAERRFDSPEEHRLHQAAQRIRLLGGFEVLLCTPLLRGVDQHPFQINTALHVMRNMRGRALLSDEVGLGKTIEAGIVLKEYVVRGLVRRVLILTPPSLVSQWREEMEDKFGLEFATSDDAEFRRLGTAAWERFDRVIASLHTAKSSKNADLLQKLDHDLVIVDEAHHLRNRTSLNWRFLNQLKSRYLLLLTATPAQNDLDELYNLITLLCPGQLKSPAAFRREFVQPGDPRRPRNHTKLRQLLMDVMVRNTRSQVNLKLPARHAATLRVGLSPAERALHETVTRLIRANFESAAATQGTRAGLRALASEVGSSAEALLATLETLRQRAAAPELRADLDGVLDLARQAGPSSKCVALIRLLASRVGPGDKVLVFTTYLRTQAQVLLALEQAGIPAARFNGSMTAAEKDAEIAAFALDRRVLVSTDAGSEGRNLQFCHTVVNFDLPWNPMRIEQRVGRVHRIGQSEPVKIFNLAATGTIEDHILEVLDAKINMFEMVVGEIGEILGSLEDEDRGFEEVVFEAWAGADSNEGARERFDQLADRLVTARQQYLKSRGYDEELFGEEFGAPE